MRRFGLRAGEFVRINSAETEAVDRATGGATPLREGCERYVLARNTALRGAIESESVGITRPLGASFMRINCGRWRWRWQAASGKRQAASGKRQAASGKRQAASGKRRRITSRLLRNPVRGD
ncbi:hypothetical protein DF043_20540 [Burkholderia cepacia]|nr:hypothetical protein DF043_20540 [Burkholderia cepacia]